MACKLLSERHSCGVGATAGVWIVHCSLPVTFAMWRRSERKLIRTRYRIQYATSSLEKPVVEPAPKSCVMQGVSTLILTYKWFPIYICANPSQNFLAPTFLCVGRCCSPVSIVRFLSLSILCEQLFSLLAKSSIVRIIRRIYIPYSCLISLLRYLPSHNVQDQSP